MNVTLTPSHPSSLPPRPHSLSPSLPLSHPPSLPPSLPPVLPPTRPHSLSPSLPLSLPPSFSPSLPSFLTWRKVFHNKFFSSFIHSGPIFEINSLIDAQIFCLHSYIKFILHRLAIKKLCVKEERLFCSRGERPILCQRTAVRWRWACIQKIVSKTFFSIIKQS